MKITMKLQKYMSQAGICSRRKAEEYIAEWLVKVNGEVAHIGQIVDSEVDKVELLDKAIKQQQNLVYYKINKPRWVVTTCANSKIWEQNIVDIVDIKERVFPIWRLDKDTTWLLILTNDWRLANYLMHPKYNHQKEYIVETFGPITDEALNKMRKWVYILDWYKTKPCKIKRISAGKYSIVLTEWKNRQIRRMAEAVGKRVKKLKRIRIENIELWKLQSGQYRHLSRQELDILFKKLGIKKEK
jgi:23S rRNA pseudouridine2605 synthase/23S rRNA pseudouridine2604 synthase